MAAPRKTIERARELRRQLTLPEIKLWQWLRTRPNGFRFRRQHPVGAYILDFYLPSAKLAIEIDGTAHDFGDRPTRDAVRDDWLSLQDMRTLRIAASDVMMEFDAVTRLILVECEETPLHRPSDGPPPHAAHEEE